MQTRRIKRYGWRPDLPDHRDLLFSAPLGTVGALPPSADLREGCPPVYDQGQLGSCTANAIGGAIEFVQMKEQLSSVFLPSRLFIYYNERSIEGTEGTDSGAQIRDGVKSVATQGACPETSWPYDIAKFADKPSDECYTEAKQDLIKQYLRLPQQLAQMKGCLASGYPFVFGFTVYDSFESEEVAQSGHLLLPGPTESVVGGHAVMAVGYEDASQCFLIRNSWGPNWGMQGYFTMPYAYLMSQSLSSDFWTIRMV